MRTELDDFARDIKAIYQAEQDARDRADASVLVRERLRLQEEEANRLRINENRNRISATINRSKVLEYAEVAAKVLHGDLVHVHDYVPHENKFGVEYEIRWGKFAEPGYDYAYRKVNIQVSGSDPASILIRGVDLYNIKPDDWQTYPDIIPTVLKKAVKKPSLGHQEKERYDPRD